MVENACIIILDESDSRSEFGYLGKKTIHPQILTAKNFSICGEATLAEPDPKLCNATQSKFG